MFLVRGVQAGVQAAEAQRVLRLAQAAGVVQNQVPTAGPLNHHHLYHEKDNLATMSMSKIEVWWALGKFGKQTKKYLVVNILGSFSNGLWKGITFAMGHYTPL